LTTELDPQLLFWLIISCLNSGFIAQQDVSGETEGEGYVLTNGSQLLIKDNLLSLSPFLLAMLDPILTQPWPQCLSAWFQSDALLRGKEVLGVCYP